MCTRCRSACRGCFAFLALRYTSEGLGRTKPIMYFGFLGLSANVLGNWVFMYGKWGMPQLGAIGCGVATAISEWLMFSAMFAYMRTAARISRVRFLRARRSDRTGACCAI